jgi:N-sulfoglucosamine sulfohydrolase
MKIHHTLIAITALFIMAFPVRSAEAKRPNILFVFADDWGRHASAYAKLDPDTCI